MRDAQYYSTIFHYSQYLCQYQIKAALKMKKILLTLLIITAETFAINLSKSYATVTATNGESVTLSNPMPYPNMSALVLRNTPNGDFALLYLKIDGTNGQIIDKDPLGGNPLATLKTIPKVGDRVIGGFLYDKVLIIAANKEQEEKVKNRYPITTVDSRLFKSYLASSNQSANAQSYKAFAKLVGIGLIFLVEGNSVKIYDPIAEAIIAKESF